jgi:TatD DNase family protein
MDVNNTISEQRNDTFIQSLQAAQYIDIHTHSSVQQDGVVAIVDTTRPNEDERFDDTHNDMIESDRYVSVGIHPWDLYPSDNARVGYDIEAYWQRLTVRATHGSVVALGETGLDKITSKRLQNLSLEIQTAWLYRHYCLSEELRKPMIIHCVRAYQEICMVRKKWNPQQVWILHGFIGTAVLAEQVIRAGCVLSFGMRSLLHNATACTLAMLPSGTFFFETDTDEKFRIADVYGRASQCRNSTLSELQRDINRAVEHVFLHTRSS